ncbi:MAG: type I methionyl aminopeptidase [candidate division NC10 bacterium]|nr:type I methionyl aminopeptidase [candidate division NC10 bacterium]
MNDRIVLKAPWELGLLRRSNRLVAETLAALAQRVKPGVTTLELDRFAETSLLTHGARPAFKGYRNYPFTLCTSINEQVVHGLPSDRRLEDGDILSLDMGAIVEGYYGDSAITVPVGCISAEAERLLRVTRECLDRAIGAAKNGARLMDISSAVQEHAEANGFSVVRVFVGHGIGKELHEAPQIPNFVDPVRGRGPVLKPGMVLAIEPMINAGGPEVRVLEDQWTAVTADGSLSAHFEHTVAITENGTEVLTALPACVPLRSGTDRKGALA